MSYIEIEIGGATRGLKFNQYACIIVQEKTDVDHPGASVNPALVYAGLKGNCYIKGENPDFTFEQVCDWVEELSEDVTLAVYKAYVSSTTWRKQNPGSDAGEKIKEIEDKKKELLTQPNTEENASLSDAVS